MALNSSGYSGRVKGMKKAFFSVINEFNEKMGTIFRFAYGQDQGG